MVPEHEKFVAYYRVSTQKQGRSGLGLEAQQAAVAAYLKQHGGVELAAFVEVESGKINDRPKLTAALERCRQSRATLLVAKLDRLSRNASFLLNLKDSGVRFEALDLPEANTLTIGIMATLAQHEREIISARTRAALAARRARGLSLGTPRDLSKHQRRAGALGRAKLHAAALARAQTVEPQITVAIDRGLKSLRQIAGRLNELEIPTPRGKTWTPTAVANALRLLEVERERAKAARHK
jgi:DNA invertase Pin-like site-specific DNA recombinase